MQSKKINELGTNLAPSIYDLTVVGDAATGQLKKITLNQIAGLFGSVGGVSSIAMTVPTGLTVTGSPITTSGTLAVSLTAGYSIPTTAKQTDWDTAFTDRNKWDGGTSGLNAATARTSLGLVIGTDVLAYRTFGTAANNNTGDFATAAQGTNADTAYNLRLTGASAPLSISGNVISISQANTTTSGFLTSTDWNTFNNKLSTTTAAATYVSYTGATADIDLGFNNFDANQINGFKIVAKLDGTNSGSLILRTGSTGYSYGNDSISLISSPTSANTLTIISDVSSVTKIAQIGLGSLTATRTFTLPNASGTIALTSNLSSYLPLAGGTLTGALGGTSASFSSSVTATAFIPTGSTIPTNGMYRSAANTLNFATNSANRFTIASDGVATFGTDLYVNRNIYVNDAESGVYADFYGRNSTSTSTPLAFLYGSAGTVTWNNGGTKMTLSSSGNLQVVGLSGTGSRTVTADASGNLSASSDSSLKQEDKTHQIEGLTEILKLQPRAYKWLSDIEIRGEEAVTEIGFFADEVNTIIPSAAPKGTDNLYGFYDRAIIAALVKGMQEQQLQIKELKEIIKNN